MWVPHFQNERDARDGSLVDQYTVAMENDHFLEVNQLSMGHVQ